MSTWAEFSGRWLLDDGIHLAPGSATARRVGGGVGRPDRGLYWLGVGACSCR
jgi:hypothetical protein